MPVAVLVPILLGLAAFGWIALPPTSQWHLSSLPHWSLPTIPVPQVTFQNQTAEAPQVVEGPNGPVVVADALFGVPDGRESAASERRADKEPPPPQRSKSVPSPATPTPGRATTPTTPRAAPSVRSRPAPAPGATLSPAAAGGFPHYPADAADAGTPEVTPAGAPAAPATAAATEVPPLPREGLLAKLLSRDDNHGKPTVQRLLRWPVSIPDLEITADFAPGAVTQADSDGVRWVIATFRGRDKMDLSNEGLFYYPSTGRGDESQWNSTALAGQTPMKMTIFFVGDRFKSARIEPHPVVSTREYGTRYNALFFRDMKLGIDITDSAELSRLNQEGEIEQRLIEDPKGTAFYAMLICDRRCDDWRPGSPPAKLAPVRYIVQFNQNSGTPPWDKLVLEKLVLDNPFTACLRVKGFKVEPERIAGGNEYQVVSDGYDNDCLEPYQAWVSNRDHQRIVVDVDAWQAADEKTKFDELTKTHLILEFHVDGLRERKLQGTLRLKYKNRPVDGEIEIKEGRAAVPRVDLREEDPAVVAKLTGFSQLERRLTGEDVNAKLLILNLQPMRRLEEFRFTPSFHVFKTPIYPDALVLDRECEYRLKVGEDANPIKLTPVLMELNQQQRHVWAVTGEEGKLEVADDTSVSLTVIPAGDKRCLAPADAKPVSLPAGNAGLVPLPIRHPQPWLLVVVTSVGLPEPGGTQEQRELAREKFWGVLLEEIEAKRNGDIRDSRAFQWLFARLVEGSAAGGATRLLSGPADAAAVERNDTIDLLEMDAAAIDDLLRVTRGGVGGGAVGLLDPGALEQALVQVARDNYPVIDDRYHTALVVRGTRTFSAVDDCASFDAISQTLAKEQVRLLWLVPAHAISDTRKILQPFQQGANPIEGLFTCPPPADPAVHQGRLLVYERLAPTLKSETPDTAAIRALGQTLEGFRRETPSSK